MFDRLCSSLIIVGIYMMIKEQVYWITWTLQLTLLCLLRVSLSKHVFKFPSTPSTLAALRFWQLFGREDLKTHAFGGRGAQSGLLRLRMLLQGPAVTWHYWINSKTNKGVNYTICMSEKYRHLYFVNASPTSGYAVWCRVQKHTHTKPWIV